MVNKNETKKRTPKKKLKLYYDKNKKMRYILNKLGNRMYIKSQKSTRDIYNIIINQLNHKRSRVKRFIDKKAPVAQSKQTPPQIIYIGERRDPNTREIHVTQAPGMPPAPPVAVPVGAPRRVPPPLPLGPPPRRQAPPVPQAPQQEQVPAPQPPQEEVEKYSEAEFLNNLNSDLNPVFRAEFNQPNDFILQSVEKKLTTMIDDIVVKFSGVYNKYPNEEQLKKIDDIVNFKFKNAYNEILRKIQKHVEARNSELTEYLYPGDKNKNKRTNELDALQKELASKFDKAKRDVSGEGFEQLLELADNTIERSKGYSVRDVPLTFGQKEKPIVFDFSKYKEAKQREEEQVEQIARASPPVELSQPPPSLEDTVPIEEKQREEKQQTKPKSTAELVGDLVLRAALQEEVQSQQSITQEQISGVISQPRQRAPQPLTPLGYEIKRATSPVTPARSTTTQDIYDVPIKQLTLEDAKKLQKTKSGRQQTYFYRLLETVRQKDFPIVRGETAGKSKKEKRKIEEKHLKDALQIVKAKLGDTTTNQLEDNFRQRLTQETLTQEFLGPGAKQGGGNTNKALYKMLIEGSNPIGASPEQPDSASNQEESDDGYDLNELAAIPDPDAQTDQEEDDPNWLPPVPNLQAGSFPYREDFGIPRESPYGPDADVPIKIAVATEKKKTGIHTLADFPKEPTEEEEKVEVVHTGEQSLKGSGDKGQGLTNVEIIKLMHKYKNFKGCVRINSIHRLKPSSQKPFGVCVFLPWEKSNEGHWVGLYIDPIHDKSIEYYDPFGKPAPNALTKQIKGIIDKMKVPEYLKFKENRIVDQRANSDSCGYMTMKFLIDRFKGKPFVDATGYSNVMKSEKNIKKYKDKFKKFGYI